MISFLVGTILFFIVIWLVAVLWPVSGILIGAGVWGLISAAAGFYAMDQYDHSMGVFFLVAGFIFVTGLAYFGNLKVKDK